MVMENIRPAKRRASKPASPSLKSVPSSETPTGTLTPKFEDRELHELLYALQALRAGDFSARMASNHIGIFGKLADSFNDIAAANQRVAHELNLVGEVVGQQGRTRHRADMGRSDGAWGQMQRSVNGLVDDLLWPTAEVTRAISAVAQGDLLQTVSLDVDGRPLKGNFCAPPRSSIQ